MTLNNFAAFILTNGRPDRVFTYETLRRLGYTGQIFLLVDNLDKTAGNYIDRFGSEVIIFDKLEIAKTFDGGDNFQDYRAIIYARNASFKIANDLNLKYFIQLDDDYRHFQFRFNRSFRYDPKVIYNLDRLFASLVKFHEATKIHSIAIAQGGDFIGGENSKMAENITLKRKCMNSFVCSTERPFQFIGRINEDVNTYTRQGSTGLRLFTTNQVTLEQMQTQSNEGGMTTLYLATGTYVKSFYSVMYQPSSVKIRILRDRQSRIHHSVNWKNTVPKILREAIRKDHKKKKAK